MQKGTRSRKIKLFKFGKSEIIATDGATYTNGHIIIKKEFVGELPASIIIREARENIFLRESTRHIENGITLDNPCTVRDIDDMHVAIFKLNVPGKNAEIFSGLQVRYYNFIRQFIIKSTGSDPCREPYAFETETGERVGIVMPVRV